MSETRRTAPLGIVIGALGSAQNAIFPAAAAGISGGLGGGGLLIGLGVGLAVVVIGSAFSYLGWRRTTYTTGETDIRVESGVLSRSARSVPYERIQDVSFEAKPLPRLLGLVAVKFETGAGGVDDLALTYLTAAEGERLRRLVRERREDEAAAAALAADPDAPAAPAPAEADPETGEVLFAMGPGRLLKFGLFEFSLAVFAVLGGALQYLDNVSDVDVWYGWGKQLGSSLVRQGPSVQALSALAGLASLLVIGSVTGVVRTFLRDWGFTLTRSARGFRRQRGLLTRTDVVMPVHRVQGLVIGTGVVRYRFGWHSLAFVSLAQDDKEESHVVAPFASMAEIAPIAGAAGFRLPDAGTPWRRASARHRTDKTVLDAAIFVIAAIPAAIFAPAGLFLIPLGMAVIAVGANLYAWEFRRHAIDARQVYASHGFLSPRQEIATRLKLHSVEIAQGPLARLRGYATVHFGLAGGSLAMHGVPLTEARGLRSQVLETITATDYSRLDAPQGAQALRSAQSGFSENLRAT